MPSKKVEKGIEDADAEVNRDFVSSFPPETAMGGIYGTSDFATMSMENIHKLSRMTYGKILGSKGGTSRDLGAFGDLVTGFNSFSTDEFMQAWMAIQKRQPLEIADEVLDVVGSVWEVVGSVGDMGESVPIVGIFVQLAHMMIDSAKSIRRSVKEVLYPIEGVKMEYYKDNDEQMARRALSVLKGKDWTRIFSPPVFAMSGGHTDARASGIDHTNVVWGKGSNQGVVLTMQGGQGLMPGFGLGFHPQTSRIPLAWQYYTGDPEKRSTRDDWTYNKGLKNRVDSFEEFHPATQQLSVLLWQRLLKNTPEIYRVDAQGIRGAWTAYFRSMEQYLTRKNDEFGTGKTAEFVRPMTKGVIERILSPEYWGNDVAVKVTSVTEKPAGFLVRWSVLGKEVPLSYYTDPKRMIMENLAGDWMDLEWRGSDHDGRKGKEIATGKRWVYGVSGPRLTARGLTQFLIDQSLKTRQMNYLKTLTIAYLTPDMPAFRNWPELKEEFLKNRAILLKHKARIYIDLKRVPESGWKNQLKASLKGIPPGLKYTLAGAKLKAAADGDVIPGSKKKAGNPITLIPAGIVKLKTKSSGGGGGGIAIAAAAALGLMVMSGKKK